MDELARGAKLGDYIVERKLGAGGMGAVYLAKHVTDGSEAALKVMHVNAAENEMLRKRFLREARATVALDHPNVVRVLKTFEADGVPVLAMEVLEGMSLDAYLAREKKLPTKEVADIFLRVTSALGTAHALGLVHRDLKPDNIFLLPNAPFVKILDFGIAKHSKGAGLQETSALTQTGTLMGSPFYMSPEQAFGEKTIDHRSDIWSMGIVIHQALSGVLVTASESLHGVFAKLVKGEFPRVDALEKSVPKDVADLVARMLSLMPDKRPEDLREVYEVLAKHATQAAETTMLFEAPVTPQVFDEPSSRDSEPEPPRAALGGSTVVMAPTPASAVQTETLALTPPSLKLQPSALAQLGGTVLLAPQAAVIPRAVQNAGEPAALAVPIEPRGRVPWRIIATVVVLIAIFAVVAFYVALSRH